MKERHSGTGFRDVDETGDAGYFVQYLDAVSALEAAQEYKGQTFSLLRAQSGHRRKWSEHHTTQSDTHRREGILCGHRA